MPLDGVDAMLAGFKKMVVAADSAGQRVVSRSQTTFQAAVQKSFTEAHTKKARTSAKPGDPPAVVTGALRRSFVADAPSRAGIGWSGRVFPTTVYARIQELGGSAGRGGATHLPARPYMRPALIAVTPALAAIHAAEFGKATRGILT